MLLDYLCRSTCLSLGKSECFTCCLHPRFARFQLHADGNPHFLPHGSPGKENLARGKTSPCLPVRFACQTHIYLPGNYMQNGPDALLKNRHHDQADGRNSEKICMAQGPTKFTRKRPRARFSAGRKAKVKAERRSLRTAQRKQCEVFLLSHGS